MSDNLYWDTSLVDLKETLSEVALLADPIKSENMAHNSDEHTGKYDETVRPQPMPSLEGSMRARQVPTAAYAIPPPQPPTWEARSTNSDDKRDDLATLFLNPNGNRKKEYSSWTKSKRGFITPHHKSNKI